MTEYRCYLLDQHGSTFARKLIECDDEVTAIAEAKAFLEANKKAEAAELWLEAFLVLKLWSESGTD